MVWDQTFSDQHSVSFSDQQFTSPAAMQTVSFSQYTSLPVQQLCRPSVYISNFQTSSFVYKQTLSICQWFPVCHFTSLAVMQTLSICQWFLDWQFCIQSDTQNLPVIFRLAVLHTVRHSVIFSSPVVYTIRHLDLASYFQFTSCVYNQTPRTCQLFQFSSSVVTLFIS